MKRITTTAVILLMSLTSSSVFAQKMEESKKAIFADYPTKIEISNNTLENVFTALPGETVSIAFNDQFKFIGTVLSNQVKYASLQSILIRSNNLANTLLQISKIMNADKTISYVGRIINPNALDGYEIKKDVANNYRLQKFETKNILQDCSY